MISITYCAQCGNAFGPGTADYSHCQQHSDVEVETVSALDEFNPCPRCSSLSEWESEIEGERWFRCAECGTQSAVTLSDGVVRV